MTIMLALAMVTAGKTAAGEWKSETHHGILETMRCGFSLCGKLLTSDGTAANPGLKDRQT